MFYCSGKFMDIFVNQELSCCRGRARHVEDAFDLDLTYVTDRIIGKH